HQVPHVPRLVRVRALLHRDPEVREPARAAPDRAPVRHLPDDAVPRGAEAVHPAERSARRGVPGDRLLPAGNDSLVWDKRVGLRPHGRLYRRCPTGSDQATLFWRSGPAAAAPRTTDSTSPEETRGKPPLAAASVGWQAALGFSSRDMC